MKGRKINHNLESVGIIKSLRVKKEKFFVIVRLGSIKFRIM